MVKCLTVKEPTNILVIGICPIEYNYLIKNKPKFRSFPIWEEYENFDVCRGTEPAIFTTRVNSGCVVFLTEKELKDNIEAIIEVEDLDYRENNWFILRNFTGDIEFKLYGNFFTDDNVRNLISRELIEYPYELDFNCKESVRDICRENKFEIMKMNMILPNNAIIELFTEEYASEFTLL